MCQVSVPELGYSTDDKPYPRGALGIKGRMLIPSVQRFLG